MVYYKVKDNFADRKFGEIVLVKNELFTKKEIENNNLPMIAFCKVNVPKNRVYCLFGAKFDSEEDEFTSEIYKKYNLKVGDHFADKDSVEKDNVTMFDIATITYPEGDYIWFNMNGIIYSCSAKNFFDKFEKVKLTVKVIRQ